MDKHAGIKDSSFLNKASDFFGLSNTKEEEKKRQLKRLDETLDALKLELYAHRDASTSLAFIEKAITVLTDAQNNETN